MRWLGLCVVLACAGASGPETQTGAEAEAEVEPEADPEADPEAEPEAEVESEAEPVAESEPPRRGDDGCFERFIDAYPCQGIAIRDDHPRQTRRVRICDMCLNDSHCEDGALCRRLEGDTCDHARRLCVPAGHECAQPAQCDGICMHRGGQPTCGVPSSPPP